MRIAEISIHSCPMRALGSGNAGGMNLYVRQLSQELARLGIEIDIFTRWHDSAEPEVMLIAEKARLIHIATGEPEDMPIVNIYCYLPQFLSNFHRFVEGQGIRYDLLHSHYWLSVWAAEQLKDQVRVPHVATFHTLGEVKNRAQPAQTEPELRLEVERKSIAAADHIIAFTAEEKDNLVRIYGAQPDKVKVVPAGVDLTLFHPTDRDKARYQLGLSRHAKVLLFAGRLDPIKGVDILLGTVARLASISEIQLLIIGGDSAVGNEMARLGSVASRLGIDDRVTFLGTVEHERMPIFYAAADVCVVPSYHESFGLVALEALACGTPVVASRVGGLATIVRDGETGYLLDELSPEAFAQRLEVLLDNRELRQRMGVAACSSVTEYTWSTVARQVLGIYEELIGA